MPSLKFSRTVSLDIQIINDVLSIEPDFNKAVEEGLRLWLKSKKPRSSS